MQRVRKILPVIFAILIILQTYSQTEIDKGAKKYYQAAIQVIDKENFKETQLNNAIENLKKAYEIDSSFSDISLYFGKAYYYLKAYELADQYFLKYKSLNKQQQLSADYFLFEGIVKYKLTDNISAQEHLQYYLNTFVGDKFKDSVCRRNLQLSRQSQTLMSKILPSKKEAYCIINTKEFDEYYPILSSDRKKIIYNRIENDSASGKMINRIYIYFLEGDTSRLNPRHLPINNIENREFIITSMNTSGEKILLVSKDNKGMYDIYESEWMIREYTAPRKLYSQINSYADDKFATYGHNDSLIYVVSNRQGGYGNYDIWKINNTSRIIYESMINLGPMINTEYNENYIAPVNNSNIIFFASEGHLNIGESDIFKTRLEYGQYTRPVNLGYPINTTADENSFFPYPTANMGLSSVKNISWDITITYLPPKAKKPAYMFEEQYLEDIHLGKTTFITPSDE